MFSAILLKEIHETIHNYRFLIALLLCILLIPLGTFVSVREYEQRLANYNHAVQIYREGSEGKISSDFSAKGFRPPSPLSFLASGIAERLPSLVNTSRTGNYWFDYENEITNPLAILFGKLDLLFCVGFVLSILALTFTFNSISGEKEKSTMRLILSNSLPRSKLYLAKITGNFIVFAIPFLIALLISMIIVNLSSSLNLFSSEILPSFAVFVLLSLLFILTMLNLGMLISSLTHSSMTSMVALLLVWIVLALVVPKASTMLAQAMFPVKAAQVVNMEKLAMRQDLSKELDNKRAELLDKVAADYKMVDSDNVFDGDYLFRRGNSVSEQTREKALEQYDIQARNLEEEYENLIGTSLKKIDAAYENNKQVQVSLAVNLSRISPLSCFTYLVSELAGTSLLELKNFRGNAERFQQYVKETIYDNYTYKKYITKGGKTFNIAGVSDGFDQKSAPVPHMTQYSRAAPSDVLATRWIDMLLLALFTLVFFFAGFVAFNRYDAR